MKVTYYTSHEAFLLGLKRILNDVQKEAAKSPKLVTHWKVQENGTQVLISME